jgi:GT2 family glycosyltransferase
MKVIFFEELDFAERVKRGGYKIYFQPLAHLFSYKESISTVK